jgi:excisionase family DNA binding protein
MNTLDTLGAAVDGPHGADPLGSAIPSNRPALTFALALTDDQLDVIVDALADRLAAAEPAGDGWLRGAGRIAAYIDCPRSRVYALVSAGRIPVERDGSNLIARRSELDAWVRDGGGKRP